MKKEQSILILSAIMFIFYYFAVMHDASECPNDYEKKEVYPLQYNAILVEKRDRGITRRSGISIKINNGGNLLLIPVGYGRKKSETFNENFWDYVEEGDSIIKPANSYRVKVVKSNKDFRFFDVDCEAHKESLKK